MNLKELTVLENQTIKEAMEKMDANAQKIIYVINEKDELTGVFSDGDLRRWILKESGNIQQQVSEAMNTSPVTIFSSSINNADKILHDKSINSIAVIDTDNVLKTIIFASNKFVTKDRLEIPVVIMAGGKGTRLYPYTKIIPKPLIPIGDTPIIERIMNKFLDYGMNRFLISVNYKKNMIKSYFSDEDHPYNLNFIEELKPLGTGGSLSLMKEQLDDDFFVSNCDILVTADYVDIYEFHKKNNHDITMVASIKNTQIPYGVLELDENGMLATTVEKPEYSHLINTGMYLINKDILDFVPEDEYSELPTIIMNAKAAGKRVGVYPVSENSWLDMGQIKEMEQMIERLGVD